MRFASLFSCCLLSLISGCYNAGPDLQEWDSEYGAETYSLHPLDEERFNVNPILGVCVLDGTFLILTRDVNNERSLVRLSGESYVRKHQSVWNDTMVSAAFFFEPCIGECFEHPCDDYHQLFLCEGQAICCLKRWDYDRGNELLKVSQHILPYTASTTLLPRIHMNGTQYNVRARHRSGKVKIFVKIFSEKESYTFSFAKAVSLDAFALRTSSDGKRKYLYFLLHSYYPSRVYLLICDDALKNPLAMIIIFSLMNHLFHLIFYLYQRNITARIYIFMRLLARMRIRRTIRETERMSLTSFSCGYMYLLRFVRGGK